MHQTDVPYEIVTNPAYGWLGPAPPEEAEFHVIGIDDPSRVEKFTHPDGREAVFLGSASGEMVPLRDGTNDATYNYVPNSSGLNGFRVASDAYQHMILDVVPWLVYGVSPLDETEISDRLAAFENSAMIRDLQALYVITEASIERAVPVSTVLSQLGLGIDQLRDALEGFGEQDLLPASVEQVLRGEEEAATRDQMSMFEALPDGLYGRADEACGVDEATVGDQWGLHFVALSGTRYRAGYETECSIVETRADNGGLFHVLECMADDGVEISAWPERWQVLSDTSFRIFETRDGTTDYILCEAEPEPVVRDPWTAAIVYDPNNGYIPCIMEADIVCLQAAGANAETLRFVAARAQEGGGGPVVPIDFQELGQVDIAQLGTFSVAGVTRPYFVNTLPESISAPLRPEADLTTLASQGDPTAAALLRQFADAYAWHFYVAGMRVLPDGAQRFSLVVVWTEFCRACPIIGFNIATVDYDLEGQFRAFETTGLFDNRAFGVMPNHSAQMLARNSALVQLALNLRGYQAGPMDGILGRRSLAALADFQREHRVNAGTGSLDMPTFEALADRATLFGTGLEHIDPAAQSCDDPATALSEVQILEFVENRSFGTREGAGRYVIREYGPTSRDTAYGEVSLSSDYGGTWETFIQQYAVQHGELCSRNLDGGGWYCERIRLCALPGEDVRVHFLDDRNQTSVTYELIGPAEVDGDIETAEEDGLPGRYETPEGFMQWLQVASRSTLVEARLVAREYQDRFPDARIFRASNGWFAITVALLDDHLGNEAYLSEQKGLGTVPTDALLTRGTTFVMELAVDPNEQVRPAFWYGQVVRNTPVYGEFLNEGQVERRYFGEVIPRGTELGVYIRDGDNCVITAHGNATVACSDLAGLESFPDSYAPDAEAPGESASDDLAPLTLADGVYAFDPQGCPVFDGTAREERQRIAANLRVTLNAGTFAQGEQTCPIMGLSESFDHSFLEMDCDYDGTPVAYSFEMWPFPPAVFLQSEETYTLCAAGQPVPDGAEETTRLVEDLRRQEPAFYSTMAALMDGEALEALLVAMQVDLGVDPTQVWSSPVYQRLMEGTVKIMLSPEVQRLMAHVGFPDTTYIYALEWPSLTDVRDMGLELVMDYAFDAVIAQIERGFEENEQPWDGGTFEVFFEAAIPATLHEAKFVLGALSDYRQGNYVDLSVNIFTESASVASDLYEAVQVFRDVQSINGGTVERAIAGAVVALQIQETMGLSGQRVPLMYSQDLNTISTPLIIGETAWNVDTGRKLRIVSELVLIRSLQMQGRDISGYVASFDRLISEYEGTPISLWDVYAQTVTLGVGGTREYSNFSWSVAIHLELEIED